MFLSLILWNTAVLLIGLGTEGALLCVVPRRAFFRRRVDESLDEAARAVGQKAHEALILQMSDAHRQELARIEVLAAKIGCNLQRQSVGTPRESEVGMSRLMASYVSLAIAYKACEESLAMTNHHALDGTIRALEAADVTSCERSRPLVRQAFHRLPQSGVLGPNPREAGSHWASARNDPELVHLMHQESTAPFDVSHRSSELDSFLTDFEQSEQALRELASIGVDEMEADGAAVIPSATSVTPRTSAWDILEGRCAVPRRGGPWWCVHQFAAGGQCSVPMRPATSASAGVAGRAGSVAASTGRSVGSSSSS